MGDDLDLKETLREWHGTLQSYTVGFVASLLLTLASFLLVTAGLLPKPILHYTIFALALVQATCQLLFFLHLGQEAKPRWETFTFYFMVLVLLIIVLGTLWIMYDLDERVMPHMKGHGS